MTDPFNNPGPVPVTDRNDPFGVPSDSGRATRTGDAESRAEVPRDQWDRYLMPHLDGTKPAANKGFTRVSTTKSALSNTFGIQDWAKRRVVEGIAKDPDLVAAALRAASMADGPDKEKALRRVASAGFDLGGGKERSGLGTEFHELTEAFNRGEDVGDPKWDAELDAYTAMLHENSIRIRPEYLERQVLCPYNNAGTFDNIVEYWNPDTEEWELVVADLKTGRSLDLGWLEIEMQLWLYANAYGMWTTTDIVRNDPKDPDKITNVEGFYEPMPRELRTDKALIFHVPLDGTATLYVIDLSGVDTYVEYAVGAKRANAEAKNKVRKISTYRPAVFVAQDPFGNLPPIEHGDVVNGFTVNTMATPDQQAQVDKATERLGLLEKIAREQGRNDGDVPEDRVQGLPNMPNGPVLDAGNAHVLASTSDAERTAVAFDPNKPATTPAGSNPAPAVDRDPVTGRKKRTCGHCHKPGHTQKTCPSNPASAKYKPTPVVRAQAESVPAGDPEPENNCDHLGDGDWHPYVAGQCPYKPNRLLKTETTPNGGAEIIAPYCTLPHTCQWTSTHPDAPGQWVCAVSGKPGQRAWEANQTAVTSEPPTYGAPDYAVGDKVAGVEFTKHSELPAWATPPDMVAWAIKQATTPTDVLIARHNAMEAGTWIQDKHDELAMARYTALSPT